MIQKQIRELFQKVYKGMSNTFTPIVVEYGIVNENLVYEISKSVGTKVNNFSIKYGVTILEFDGTKRFDLNCHLENLPECYIFIKSL